MTNYELFSKAFKIEYKNIAMRAISNIFNTVLHFTKYWLKYYNLTEFG